MREIILFVAVGICVLWGACGNTIVEPPVNMVKGTVIDSQTLVPIDSAWVDNDTLAPHSVFTDSLGNYQMPIGHTGRHFIYCGKDAYVTRKKEIVFTGNGITATINFQLVAKSNH
jgi:hypothetical protein